MNKTDKKSYSKQHNKILSLIVSMQNILSIYYSYEQNIWQNKEKLDIENESYPWVLYYLGNSLVINLYMILRRVLSTGQKEYSLPNLYKLVLNPEILLDSSTRYDDALFKIILPKSYEKWKALKQFINKTIAHSDTEYTQAEHFDPKIIEQILQDIETAFSDITLAKDKSSSSYDRKVIKKIADEVFTRMMRVED